MVLSGIINHNEHEQNFKYRMLKNQYDLKLLYNVECNWFFYRYLPISSFVFCSRIVFEQPLNIILIITPFSIIVVSIIIQIIKTFLKTK